MAGAPVAYCPLGRKYAAELTLTLKGEPFSEVIEHPWLKDWDGILLVTDPGQLVDWQVPATAGKPPCLGRECDC
jgi:hypothetical protein